MHLAHFIRRQARHARDRIAATEAGAELTFAELEVRVARLAGAFLSQGAAPGGRVAFLVTPGLDAAILYFAPLWAGLIGVPLNLRWTEGELRDALHIVKPDILVLDKAHRRIGLAASSDLAGLRAVFVTGEDADGLIGTAHLQAQSDPIAAMGEGGDATAALFFTSGTTSAPRAVQLSHRNIWLNAMCSATLLGIDDRASLLQVQPLFHLAGGARLYTSVMAGARQDFLPRFDAGVILEQIPSRRSTHIGLVPTMLSMLLDANDHGKADLSSLRVVGYGAAPMRVALLTRAMALMPETGFVNSYGMTELSPLVTCLDRTDHARAAAGRPDLLETVGRPVWNVEVALTDDAGANVTQGRPGEILVRGPTVMQGYFGEDPADGPVRDGWYHTGDIGVFEPDGYLRLVDRKKDIIITGGENVASLEVENVLSHFPGVRECAVIARPDAAWGERVHAVVVCEADVTEAALEAHCRARLAAYKCPRSWSLGTSPLPRTSVGKIDKRGLRS